MQRFGYRIVPVRPALSEVLGEKAYAKLADIPFPVDLVNVFRESAAIPGVVEEALAINAPAIWIQEGIVHDEAAEKARAAGLTVVMDRCIYKDYMRYMP
jgi:predicted CoA-binding protein